MAVDVEAEIFSAESYNLNIPTLDDRKATKLAIQFSGTAPLIELPRTISRCSRRCGSELR